MMENNFNNNAKNKKNEKYKKEIKENKKQAKTLQEFKNFSKSLENKHIILKKKIKKNLDINLNIYTIAQFPCGNIILTTIIGKLFLYDKNFNFLVKEENNYYNKIFIKDNKYFSTYDESIIQIWEIDQNNYLFNSINFIILNLPINTIKILSNDDVIGITSDNEDYKGPYECFIYNKGKNDIYEKKVI